ncbi:RAMP superfamily CRISPR-associated protein [Haloechinothrix sp. LS1_15]|uniref:RAMP superfamily CRISPR-associated protein n=1 Tax=Haloechinothrix sp. LS1_15 TaxID=2652248 RepID=UPI0029486981|nr:RAMP superfamily CRISPR-associated protein [Haloechinothrix sp. LS1_15]MDV6011651.1 RAMP superfamily protein [Haloechinothrix sp. LS1_15]
MNTVEFTMTFHTPFRVSSGKARDGVNETVDPIDALPATSLKGVMRASAATLLGSDNAHVSSVFGSGTAPSPWRWSAARPEDGSWETPRPVARIAIDSDTQTARRDMLAFAEQTGALRATFTVSQLGYLDEHERRRHELVLAVCGQATRSIGAQRRRGLGWVGIRCTSHTVDADAVAEFVELMRT